MAKATRSSRRKPSNALEAVFRGDERYCFVRAVYPPAGVYGTNRQPAYQLVVMIQGEARVLACDETFLLREGEALLVHPGWAILYHFSERSQSVHTSCQVAPHALTPAERRLLAKTRGVHSAPPALHPLINEGLSAPLVAGPAFHDAQTLLARACLMRFVSHVAESPKNAPPPHPALMRATQILENAPAALRSAADLAEQCGISVSRLRQLHRAAGRESPSSLLWRIKTEHAVRMIRATSLTLGEVAAQSGFSNPFHLSRSVKKLTGSSPKELRRLEWSVRGNAS